MRTAVLVVVAAAIALAGALATAPFAAAESVSWQQVFDGRLHGGDAFTAIAVAPDGGVYAAGYAAVSSANRSDMLLVRYAPNGSRSWVRQWNGPASGSDQCWDVARYGRGGLYLVGFCHLRHALRIFAVERVRGLELLAETFAVPADLVGFFGRGLGIIFKFSFV